MFRQASIAFIISIILAGCYCRNYQRGSSSTRFLTTVKSYNCFIGKMDTCSGIGIKNLLGTVYTSDPYFQQRQARKEKRDNAIEMNFVSHFLIGLRLESLYSIGRYPGPLVGIGIDYSYAEYAVAFNRSSYGMMQETINTHRMNLGFNVVTWITPKMIGYISVQPGYERRRTEWKERFPQNIFYDADRFNFRAGYGFQFYFNSRFEVNLELGYGSGAFLRGGLGMWF